MLPTLMQIHCNLHSVFGYNFMYCFGLIRTALTLTVLVGLFCPVKNMFFTGSVPFHLLPFVRSSCYEKPKIKFMHI